MVPAWTDKFEIPDQEQILFLNCSMDLLLSIGIYDSYVGEQWAAVETYAEIDSNSNRPVTYDPIARQCDPSLNYDGNCYGISWEK